MSTIGVVKDPSIAAVWGSVIIPTFLALAFFHLLFGAFAIRHLVLRDFRLIFVPIGFFVIGSIHALLSAAPLSFAIAVVHYSVRGGLATEELVVYTVSLVVTVAFFSMGRIPNLYSL